MNLKVIAFDADDTLFVNEPYFEETEQKFCALMSDYLSHQGLSQELFRTEINNLDLLEREGIKYPSYLKKEKFRYYTLNLNILKGYLKFYTKWGGYYSLNIKYIILKKIPFLRRKLITRILYSTIFKF